VDVAAATAAGVYAVDYQICELVNPANCDTATVTVTVSQQVPAQPPQTPAPSTSPPSADLSITKTGPEGARSGDTVTFAIEVANAGPDAAERVVVTDALPDGLVLRSAVGDGWACTTSSGTVRCERLVLEPGAAAQLRVVSQIVRGAGEITNTATVSSGTEDPVRDNDAASVTTRVTGVADLVLRKTASTSVYVPGRAVSFTIVVANDGPGEVTGARVRDALPSALAGFSWTCTARGGSCATARGRGSIDTRVDLRPRGRAIFSVTGVVPAGAAGTIRNAAQVTAPAGTFDPVRGNNTDAVTVRQGTAPTRLRVRLSPSSVVAAAGEVVRLTATTTNVGRFTAIRVVTCVRLPMGASVADPRGGFVSGGRFCWRDGSLRPGARITHAVKLNGDRRVAARLVVLAEAFAANAPRTPVRSAVVTAAAPKPQQGGFTG
jgi:uncharacterized repeat protein (TIGR01451 family)